MDAFEPIKEKLRNNRKESYMRDMQSPPEPEDYLVVEEVMVMPEPQPVLKFK